MASSLGLARESGVHRLPDLRLDSLPDSFPYDAHGTDGSDTDGDDHYDRSNDEFAWLESHAVILAAAVRVTGSGRV